MSAVTAAPETVRSRDTSIDVLKGLGIIVVMAGHIDVTAVGTAFVGYLYSFNVAVFFVVAGYTWRPKPGTPFARIAWQRIRQIGVPYVALFTVSLLYGHLVVRYVFGIETVPFSFSATIKALLFGSEWLNSVPTFNFALWFLPIFLIASLVFQLLQQITVRWVWICLVVGLLASAVPLQILLPGRPILNLNVLPVAVGLMACGHVLRRLRIAERLDVWTTVAFFVLTLIVAAYSYGNVSDVRTYAFYPAALAAFLVLLRVSGDLRGSALLQFVGRNSLLFFGIHSLVASTWGLMGVPTARIPQLGGVLGYLVNLAYVFLVTFAIVAAWRGLRARITESLARRRAGRIVDRMPIPEAGFPRAAALSPRVQVVETTGSTNADVLEAAAADPVGWPHLSLLLTLDQREGRGRHGRSWVVPAGTGLAVSAVVRLGPVPTDSRGWIPLLAGAAMAEAVAAQLERRGTVTLKWPNDVLVDDRKIAGILAQAAPGDPDLVVVGAGVNTRMAAEDLPVATATSFAIRGVDADLDRLLADWLTVLRDRLAAFAVADGDADRSGVRAAVEKRMSMLGGSIQVVLPDGERLTGRAVRLDGAGRLVVDADGVETPVAAGDVTSARPA